MNARALFSATALACFVLSVFCIQASAQSPGGQELWVIRYNGPEDLDDCAADMSIDGEGNIVVVGTASVDNGEGRIQDDYVTIKYDPDGALLWVARYDGPISRDDNASDVAIDPSGNVYVTGESCSVYESGCTQYQYATVKYSPDGDELWARRSGRFDSEQQDPCCGRPAPSIDAEDLPGGDVVVSGRTAGGTDTDDVFTIRYDALGDTLWERTYDGPAASNDWAAACAFDADGNVFVTGSSYNDSDSDCITIKYDSCGTELWIVREHFELGDWGKDLAVDPEGNVIVAGDACFWEDSWVPACRAYGVTAHKYDPTGEGIWTSSYGLIYEDTDHRDPHIVLDGLGNTILAATREQYGDWRMGRPPMASGVAVIKIDDQGERLWVDAYIASPWWNGWTSPDRARSVAVDGAGNIYMTAYGELERRDENVNLLTSKYLPDGEREWLAVFDEPERGDSWPETVAVDSDGFIYVAGSSQLGQEDDYDIVTIKYAPTCGGCLIEGICWEDGTVNRRNTCQYCDVGTSQQEWTLQPDGVACEDELFCTVETRCVAGDCTGDPRDCDDGLWCTSGDFCDESVNECRYPDLRCRDDYQFCNGEEACDEENDQCIQINVPDCSDDGQWCNGTEFCDEENDRCGHRDVPCQDDHNYCNGTEACDEEIDECIHVNPPECPDDGIFCNGEEVCDEWYEQCVHTGDPCQDYLFCNGADLCDEQDRSCRHTGDPCAEGETCNEVRDVCVPGEADDDSGDVADDDDSNGHDGDDDDGGGCWG